MNDENPEAESASKEKSHPVDSDAKNVVSENYKKLNVFGRVKTHKFVIAFALLGLLGYGHYWLMQPRDNSTPSKKVVVRGTFPYDRGLDLRIEASYYTKNPTCKQTARVFFFFPQADVARGAWKSVPVWREGENRYAFEFYEDALLPGFCEWTLHFVHYRIDSDRKEILSRAMLGFPSQVNRMSYGCKFSTLPKTEEIVTLCLEDGGSFKDTSQKDGEVNFYWKGSEK